MAEEIRSAINAFAQFYGEYNSMTEAEALRDFEEYGVIDYILRWHYLLGHARKEQIAKRLTDIVQKKKSLRHAYGLLP